MPSDKAYEIVVIGAGIAGIATAFFLSAKHKRKSVLLIDSRQPMSYTSAQSGDNYRNWWPHPTMVEFTNDSIDLMETVARQTSNVFNMTRRGYVLTTRRNDIDDLVTDLRNGYPDHDSIRLHSPVSASSYQPALTADWTKAPDGVDVLSGAGLIRKMFPAYDPSINNVIHIRRAGDFDGQQLGQYMLTQFRQSGGKRLMANVLAIDHNQGFLLHVDSGNETQQIQADIVVNAAGPFAGKIGKMIGKELPIDNVFQQKIAFEDSRGTVPRTLPFSIDLDEKRFTWTDEEAEWLAGEPGLSWLTQTLPGGTHCRPEGGDRGTWIKLGWAYNQTPGEPQQDINDEPQFDPHFPEIVMRAAAMLQPKLGVYMQDFPTRRTHYGGYYSMTKENWPLIGPAGVDGAFIVGALSGFGSMAACAAGSLLARHINGHPLPAYAAHLSLERYQDQTLMEQLTNTRNKGLL